jgi:prepilin-type processing-associated H-X9-DG protein
MGAAVLYCDGHATSVDQECTALPECDAKKCVSTKGWKATLKTVVNKANAPTCLLQVMMRVFAQYQS